MPAADAALTLDGVVAGYGKMTILNGTTFNVRRAAITTVIGPNGAGKSTVFKAIFGLLPVREGRIVFDGADITNLAPRELLARGICYVPQGRNIFPELSVRHNLELGGVADAFGRRSRAAHRGDHGPLPDAAAEGQRAGLDAFRRPAEAARDRAQPAARSEAAADRRAVDRALAAAGARDLRHPAARCATAA